jgi:hypothetical protein
VIIYWIRIMKLRGKGPWVALPWRDTQSIEKSGGGQDGRKRHRGIDITSLKKQDLPADIAAAWAYAQHHPMYEDVPLSSRSYLYFLDRDLQPDSPAIVGEDLLIEIPIERLLILIYGGVSQNDTEEKVVEYIDYCQTHHLDLERTVLCSLTFGSTQIPGGPTPVGGRPFVIL